MVTDTLARLDALEAGGAGGGGGTAFQPVVFRPLTADLVPITADGTKMYKTANIDFTGVTKCRVTIQAMGTGSSGVSYWKAECGESGSLPTGDSAFLNCQAGLVQVVRSYWLPSVTDGLHPVTLWGSGAGWAWDKALYYDLQMITVERF